jgi:hypothetical protein
VADFYCQVFLRFGRWISAVDHMDHVKTTLAVWAVYALQQRCVVVSLLVRIAVITTARTACLLISAVVLRIPVLAEFRQQQHRPPAPAVVTPMALAKSVV